MLLKPQSFQASWVCPPGADLRVHGPVWRRSARSFAVGAARATVGLDVRRKRHACGSSASQLTRPFTAATPADLLTALLRAAAGRSVGHTAPTGICPLPPQKTHRDTSLKVRASVKPDACQFFYGFTCAATVALSQRIRT